MNDGGRDHNPGQAAQIEPAPSPGVAPSGEWGRAAPLPTGPLQAASETRSGNALSLVYSDLRSDLDGAAAPLAECKSTAFEVPFELARSEGLWGVFGELRATISLTAGAEAIVFFAVNGSAKTVELDYGQGQDGDDPTALAIETRNVAVRLFSAERWPAEAQGEAFHPRPPIAVTVLIIARRRSAADTAVLSVDTIDLVAHPYR